MNMTAPRSDNLSSVIRIHFAVFNLKPWRRQPINSYHTVSNHDKYNVIIVPNYGTAS
jgi:hypothetical protein